MQHSDSTSSDNSPPDPSSADYDVDTPAPTTEPSIVPRLNPDLYGHWGRTTCASCMSHIPSRQCLACLDNAALCYCPSTVFCPACLTKRTLHTTLKGKAYFKSR